MTMEQKIKVLAAYKSITQAEIARLIGMTPQNFNKKVKRGTFSAEELTAMAEALGVVYISAFELPDGTRI